MVRIITKKLQDDDINYYEFSGLSTDDKPTSSIVTGSLFLEVDTGDVYAYDEEGEEGEEWKQIAALGGGS